MKFIVYIITISFLRFLAILPKKILYLISDFLFFLLFYLVKYRISVVRENLKKAFPEKTAEELKRIRKSFYKNLADVIIENAVIQFYPKKRLEKMFSFSNDEIMNDYYETGRHIVLITGHYNNWEWALPLSYTFDHLVIGVYKPLKNKWFDKAVKKARTRFGAAVVPMQRIGRALIDFNNKGILTLTGMVADQRPMRSQIHYWTMLLNQKSAIFTGSEKLARKFNSVVVFMKVRRLHRGVYKAEIELITDKPLETSENEITEKHTRILEDLILEEPANWLWSHKRWKLSYEEWNDSIHK